jgi:hypothetical protein
MEKGLLVAQVMSGTRCGRWWLWCGGGLRVGFANEGAKECCGGEAQRSAVTWHSFQPPASVSLPLSASLPLPTPARPAHGSACACAPLFFFQARAFHKWLAETIHSSSVARSLHRVAFVLARSKRDVLRMRLHRWHALTLQSSCAAASHAAQAVAAHSAHAARAAQQLLRAAAIADRQCRLTTQRAFFRLRHHALATATLVPRRRHALRACLSMALQWRTTASRAALLHWRAVARAEAVRFLSTTAALRRLLALAAGGARELQRDALGRWRAAVTAAGAAELAVERGASSAARLVLRWQRGALARGFRTWQTQVQRRRVREVGASAGAAAVQAVLRRRAAELMGRGFHCWALQVAAARQRDAQRWWRRGVVAQLLFTRVERCVREAWHRWRARTSVAALAAQAAAATAAYGSALAGAASRRRLRRVLRAWGRVASREAQIRRVLGRVMPGPDDDNNRQGRSQVRRREQMRRGFQRWRTTAARATLALKTLARLGAVAASQSRETSRATARQALQRWWAVTLQMRTAEVAAVHERARRVRLVVQVLVRARDALLRPAWLRWVGAASATAAAAAGSLHVAAARDLRRRVFVVQVLARARDALLRPAWLRWAGAAAAAAAAAAGGAQAAAVQEQRRRLFVVQVLARSKDALLRPAWQRWVRHTAAAAATAAGGAQAAAAQQQRQRLFVVQVLARSRDALLRPAFLRWLRGATAVAAAAAGGAQAAASQEQRRRLFVVQVLARARDAVLRPAWDRWRGASLRESAARAFRSKLRDLGTRLEAIHRAAGGEGRAAAHRTETLARRAVLGACLSAWKTVLGRTARARIAELREAGGLAAREAAALEWRLARLQHRTALCLGMSALKLRLVRRRHISVYNLLTVLQRGLLSSAMHYHGLVWYILECGRDHLVCARRALLVLLPSSDEADRKG